MYKNIILLLLILGVFSSCFKDDEMVPAHDPGDVTTVVIPMTMYYTYQMYYNLENNEIISQNNRSAFDLNFSCIDSLTEIRLNTANFAMVAETQFQNMEDVTDTVGMIWNYDKSDGNPDSTVFKNWISINNENDTSYSNNVWVINRGITSLGLNLGLKKVQFTSFKNNKYYFKFSNLDNTEMYNAEVSKSEGFSFVQFLLDGEGEIMQIEPEKDKWDLNFTQYTTLLFTDEGLSYPYLVTGVLQNTYKTLVALDTTMVFSDITIADTAMFDYSNSFDKIGYNWKDIIGDVESGSYYYETRLDYNFIIKDSKSYFYKLRFINFYDTITGEKGYPEFEYQRL